MKISELLLYGKHRLKSAGVSEAELDARLLLEDILKKDRIRLYLDADEKVEAALERQFAEVIGRRCQREPVAYILGEREFWSLPFWVNPDVLIPRPETEFLLEVVFAKSSQENFLRASVLDLCTGSGVIAVVLAKERKKTSVFASDISTDALVVAQSNAIRHGVVDRVSFVCCDTMESFANKRFSLVVSNPPYIIRQDVENELAPEVADFEPHLALDGGEDGLVLIRRIERQLQYCMVVGGDFFLEFGADQGEDILHLFRTAQWQHVEIFQDYAGRDRVLWARKA